MMKTLRWFGLIALFILLLSGAATAWLVGNEERVEAMVIQEIGKRLKTDAHITDLNLTWWRSFPLVSIELRDIWLAGSSGLDGDRLLQADMLSLQVKLDDLLQNQITVQNIRLSDAIVHLKSGQKGWNTEVWENDDSQDSGLGLAIEKGEFRDVRFVFETPQKQVSTFHIQQADCGLQFDEQGQILITTSGQGHDLSIQNERTPKDLTWSWNASGAQNLEGNWNWEIPMLQSESLQIAGELLSDGNAWRVNGAFAGLDASWAKAAIPGFQSLLTENDLDWEHSFSGAVQYDGKRFELQGSAPRGEWHHGLASGEASTDLEVTHSGDRWSIAFLNVQAQIPGLTLGGDIESDDVASGNWNADVDLNFDAEQADWTFAVLPDHLRCPTGQLAMHISATYHGQSDHFETHHFDIHLQEVSLNAGGWPGTIHTAHVQGEDVENWKVTDLAFTTLDNSATGTVLSRSGQIEAALDSRRLRVPENFPEINWPDTDSETPNLKWTALTWQADELFWAAFADGAMSTNNAIHLIPASHDKSYQLNWSSNIAGGSQQSVATIDFERTIHGSLEMHTSAQDLLLQPLFATFRNFGQSALRSEHLQGTVHFESDVTWSWSPQFTPLSSTVQAQANLNWSQVRLDNVESFQDIAEYLRNNRLIAPLVDPDDLAHRLRKIDLESCEMQALLVNGDFRLAPVRIHSSAMDVDISGGQTWAGALDYTFGFALRDLKNTREDAFGIIEDDGLGHRFFLTMQGSYDEPEYGWDREAGKNARKERFEEEKTILRDLFRRNKSRTP
ncbi:MAG: hypothetical protein ACPGYK_08130 [Flavobacteriales bacterium]